MRVNPISAAFGMPPSGDWTHNPGLCQPLSNTWRASAITWYSKQYARKLWIRNYSCFNMRLKLGDVTCKYSLINVSQGPWIQLYHTMFSLRCCHGVGLLCPKSSHNLAVLALLFATIHENTELVSFLIAKLQSV